MFIRITYEKIPIPDYCRGQKLEDVEKQVFDLQYETGEGYRRYSQCMDAEDIEDALHHILAKVKFAMEKEKERREKGLV